MLFKSEDTRRKVTLVAGLLFFVGMSQSLIASFAASSPEADNTAQAIDRTSAEQVDLEAGYNIVLEREPDNQTALKGLVEARMAKENWNGMIAPLDKLIALNPEDESYRSLQKIVKEKLAQTDTAPPEASQVAPPVTQTETP